MFSRKKEIENLKEEIRLLKSENERLKSNLNGVPKVSGVEYSFRIFPNNYSNFTQEEKKMCDEVFASYINDDKKRRDMFYYTEILYFDDSNIEELVDPIYNKENILKPEVSVKTKNYITKANLIHGNKYDYSMINYTRCRDKIKIICSEHGIFEQRANNHLYGNSCPKCSRQRCDLGDKKKNTIIPKTKIQNQLSLSFDLKEEMDLKNPNEYSPEFLEFLNALK